VTNSPNLGRARSAPTPYDNLGGSRPSKKRPREELEVEGTKCFQRDEGFGRGRCGGNRGGSIGRTSPNTSRINFSAITGALTTQERKRHQEEGRCFCAT
jgi:hypothetical protein